jgi:hypothetical protein
LEPSAHVGGLVEYIALRASHPTYLNLQLPQDVATLVGYVPAELRELRSPARSISFLARIPQIVRVIATYRGGEVLPIETTRNRFLASAGLTEKMIFNLPEAVVQYLGLEVKHRVPAGTRYTDDGLLWFLPAEEYYEFRERERLGKPWNGPADGGLTRVYLSHARLPSSSALESLEGEIDQREWRPRLELAARTARPRRTTSGT